MIIDVSTFFSEVPSIDVRLLAEGYASEAINCDIETGKLQPLRNPLSVQSVESDTVDIYKLSDSFLEWNTPVSIVKSLLADSGDRVFYSGDGYPKDTNASLALSEASPYPNTTRRLGIPNPTNALVVTLNGTASEDVIRQGSYVYTRVGKWEDGSTVESGPSAPTSVFQVYEGITPVLSGFTDLTTNGVYITHYRLYRLTTGTTGAVYQYMAEIPVGTASYSDTVLDAELGEVIPSLIWSSAPDDIQGLISTSHGLVFGFVDNTIYPSEVFIPYSFPENYALKVESPIVGIGYTGSRVIILTETVPYTLEGSNPESLSLTRLGFQQPCVSAKSIVELSGGVIYASPDGLIHVDAGGTLSNVTSGIFTKTQWKAKDISNIIGVYYNDHYYAFFSGSNEGFKLNLSTRVYLPLDLIEDVYGATYSPADDLMYLVQDDADEASLTGRKISSINAGSLATYTWVSKEYEGTQEWLSACYIDSDFTEGALDVSIFVDGVCKTSKQVDNSNIFYVPVFPGNSFRIKVTGKSTIKRFTAATTYSEITERLLRV